MSSQVICPEWSFDFSVTLLSFWIGLDLESHSPDSTKSQSNQIPTTHNQVYNQDAEWEQVEEEASEESDKPVVQVDEEDIQTDTSLVYAGFCMTDVSDPTELLSCGQPGPWNSLNTGIFSSKPLKYTVSQILL